jgi:hypothetical protein
MRKFLYGFVLGGLLGGVVGVAVAVFAYPFIFLADIEASEALPEAPDRRLLARGEFIHADPSDPLHYGRGAVALYSDAVQLGADFEVGPGPKFHLYLVPLDQVTPETDVEAADYVDLGQLRAFKGSQVFRLPAGLDPAAYGSVVIWCKQFGVLVSPAKLAFEQAATN